MKHSSKAPEICGDAANTDDKSKHATNTDDEPGDASNTGRMRDPPMPVSHEMDASQRRTENGKFVERPYEQVRLLRDRYSDPGTRQDTCKFPDFYEDATKTDDEPRDAPDTDQMRDVRGDATNTDDKPGDASKKDQRRDVPLPVCNENDASQRRIEKGKSRKESYEHVEHKRDDRKDASHEAGSSAPEAIEDILLEGLPCHCRVDALQEGRKHIDERFDNFLIAVRRAPSGIIENDLWDGYYRQRHAGYVIRVITSSRLTEGRERTKIYLPWSVRKYFEKFPVLCPKRRTFRPAVEEDFSASNDNPLRFQWSNCGMKVDYGNRPTIEESIVCDHYIVNISLHELRVDGFKRLIRRLIGWRQKKNYTEPKVFSRRNRNGYIWFEYKETQ